MSEITHISDTALMVAACRARETDRADGFIRDPFAGRLAGERGMAILDALPNPGVMCFGIGTRSRFMDELVSETANSGEIAALVSIGCGLDTRPWRLELPAHLRWIEVDFAEMLDYKSRLMASERPHCRIEQVTADITDPAQRRALHDAVTEPALMITEGLLMYLPASAIEALAAETPAGKWLTDITSSGFAKALNMDQFRSVQNLRSSESLPGEQILEIMYRHGWKTGARRSYITDMGFAKERIEKMMASRPQPAEAPPALDPSDPTGVHLLTRA